MNAFTPVESENKLENKLNWELSSRWKNYVATICNSPFPPHTPLPSDLYVIGRLNNGPDGDKGYVIRYHHFIDQLRGSVAVNARINLTHGHPTCTFFYDPDFSTDVDDDGRGLNVDKLVKFGCLNTQCMDGVSPDEYSDKYLQTVLYALCKLGKKKR